jgi:teichuronic acid biosynthesis glycosyltransferase TuaG
MGVEDLVSIIMPVYNGETTIGYSIESVIAQTYSHWELIIIDDCSLDDTRRVVLNYTDPRIKLITQLYNSGSPAQPRNIGLDIAQGQYIAFLDSDDLWFSNKLEIQLNFMKSKSSFFSCTGYQISDSSLHHIKCNYQPPETANYSQLLTNNSVGCLTALINRELIGDMRFPLCGHEDYALWLKLVKKSVVIHGLDNILATYRIQRRSVSSNKLKLMKFYFNIYRNEEGYSCTKSLIFCARYLINVTLFKYR